MTKKSKRREPEAPPGLEPREPMEDVYDVGRDMGTFTNLVNSGRAESQNLATFGEVAQGPFSASPLKDALTLPTRDSVDFVPTLNTMMTQGPQNMLLSKNLETCW